METSKRKTKSNKALTGRKTSVRRNAKCTAIASRGIKTASDFAGCMSALMSDIATERIGPQAANAMCNAGGKLLKIVDMKHKYETGKVQVGGKKAELLLT